MPVQRVSHVIAYDGWFIVVSYFAAGRFFDQFMPEAQFIVDRLRSTSS